MSLPPFRQGAEGTLLVAGWRRQRCACACAHVRACVCAVQASKHVCTSLPSPPPPLPSPSPSLGQVQRCLYPAAPLGVSSILSPCSSTTLTPLLLNSVSFCDLTTLIVVHQVVYVDYTCVQLLCSCCVQDQTESLKKKLQAVEDERDHLRASEQTLEEKVRMCVCVCVCTRVCACACLHA